MKYRVIRDKQEKKCNGWIFEETGECDGTTISHLPTGDYTLEGYEGRICIERKGTVGEFAHNLIEARFERELIRMDKFEHSILLLEFELNDLYRFPKGSGIPEKKWSDLKLTPQFILKKYSEILVNHPHIRIIFAGSRGQEVATLFFRYFMRLQK
jgi:ERCC4-type nuclease